MQLSENASSEHSPRGRMSISAANVVSPSNKGVKTKGPSNWLMMQAGNSLGLGE